MMSSTQFPGPRSTEVCDVVIGFDFGTSCSKVVLRTPFHNAGRAFAVPFGHAGHPSCNHLLPSVLWLGEDDHASLVRFQGANLLRDIKFHLMRGENVPRVNGAKDGRTYDQKIVAVTFLASAIRIVRKWFLERQRDLYGDFTLRWTFNLGLPSSDYADKSLCETYRDIASAAWCLSTLPFAITLGSAAEIVSSPDTWNHLDENDIAEINAVSEVVAEVTGYARSDVRDSGLYLLVDVGASTLDVCSFILHGPGGDAKYNFLTADVQPLGTLHLYQHRVSGVREAVDSHVDQLWNRYDPVCEMPDESAEYFEYLPCHNTISRSIDAFNTAYRKECHLVLWTTILDLKRRRDPHSPRWKSKIPVFLSGGGSVMPFYQSTMQKLSQSIHQLYSDCDGILLVSLPKPAELVADVNDHNYHRLAVAWGLSDPDVPTTAVSRPDEAPDIEPLPVHDWREGFISKDMV